MLSFKPTFSLSSFTFIKRFFSSLLSAIKMVSSAYLRLLMFLPAILIPAIGFKSLQLALWKLRYSAVPLTCRSLLELAAESLEELLMLWNDKMCQVHCVHFLPHTRYQPFLQEVLASCSWKWDFKATVFALAMLLLLGWLLFLGFFPWTQLRHITFKDKILYQFILLQLKFRTQSVYFFPRKVLT